MESQHSSTPLEVVRTAVCRTCGLQIVQYGTSRWWHGEFTTDHISILNGPDSLLRRALIAYTGNVSVNSKERTDRHMGPFIAAWRDLLGGEQADVIRFDAGSVPPSHLNRTCRGGLAGADRWDEREQVSKSAKAAPKPGTVREFPA